MKQGEKVKCKLICGCVAISVMFSSAGAQAGAINFDFLIGRDVNSSESALQSRGYEKIHTEANSGGNQNLWWSANNKDCVIGNESYGKYVSIFNGSQSDCDPYIKSSNSGAVLGVLAGAAAIAGVAALINHNKKKKEGKDDKYNQEYDQGYNDGVNNYHRYGDHSDAYNDGFAEGRDERLNNNRYSRNNNSRDHGRHDFIYVNDLRGNRASSGESELRARGFRVADGYKGHRNSYVYWVNHRVRECVQVKTNSGRFSEVNVVAMNQCV